MANLMEVIELAHCSLRPSADFSANDADTAFRNALVEYMGLNVAELDKITTRDIRNNREAAFEIIETVIDEVLPKSVEDFIGVFAEVKQFARDEEPIFKIKNINKNRVAMGISGASRGGIYKARRLDNRSLAISTKVQGVAYMATLEEIILGKSTLSDLLEIITKGFVDITLIEVVKHMRGLSSVVPTANKKTAATNDPATLSVALDGVLSTVKRYGNATIVAFESVAANIMTVLPSGVASNRILGADAEAIRSKGYVDFYKGGVPVVVLPNYFIDETNSNLVFNENTAWVIPSDNKPVIVALKGDAYTRMLPQAAGGEEYHVHKLMGVGIMFNNQVGMVTVSSGAASGLN